MLRLANVSGIDHFSFAIPLLILADPGAGSWLKSCWQTLFGEGGLQSLLAGLLMVIPGLLVPCPVFWDEVVGQSHAHLMA